MNNKQNIKRMFDIILALSGIVIISPVFLLIASLIKIDSKGPVFFLQERIGLRGKVFKIFKFRTMIVGAEEIGDGLSVKNESDNRITKIGKILRATSLDELPQLLNVLNGDMSLVGPRPPVTYHPYLGYDNYPGWAKKRFDVRPGITGLTQVTVRNSVSWDERIRVDNKYISEFSLTNDLKILVSTLSRVLKTTNIYD